MTKRLLTAMVGIPLILLIVWVGEPWVFTLFVATVAILGSLELTNIFYARGLQPQRWLMLLWVAALVIGPQLGEQIPLFVMTAGIYFSLIVLLFNSSRDDIFTRWGTTCGGALYLGWTLSHAPLLLSLDQGREWVGLWIFATFATDTGAFVVGKVLGTHPLAPTISPKKTWEGAIGGWILGVSASGALALFLSLDVSWWVLLSLGGLIGVFGQIGDLVESMFKRGAHLKEASSLLPGHGGVLDRLDSVVFTLPVVYYGVMALNGG